MAVIDTTRSQSASVGVVGQVLAKFAAAFTDWKDARATRKALEQLSDRELDDIGLSRGQIDRVVRRA